MSHARAEHDVPMAYPPDGGAARTDRRSVDEHDLWESRTRIFLTPLSAPSIIGLYGFMGATLMVGAWQAGWYGDAKTGFILFPFALMFGGLMQGAAAFPALRARDGLAAGIHATWGAFWLGFGLLFGLGAAGIVPISKFGQVDTAFAFWFIVLTLITGMGAIAALFDNLGIAGVLWLLAVGSGFTAAGWWAGWNTSLVIGGWLFVASAVVAWYAASAMVLKNVTGRTILPTGELKKAANIPGRMPGHPIEYTGGMPGVKIGQ